MQQRVTQGETVSVSLGQFDDAGIGERGRDGGVYGGIGVKEEHRTWRAILHRL